MRLSVTKSGTTTNYYVIKSINRDGKRSSQVVERLGSEEEIKATYHVADAKAWALDHIAKLNEQEEKSHIEMVSFNREKRIASDSQNCFNVGYLFLQQIYYALGFPAICKNIALRNNFQYNLDEILSRLIYDRILFPSSKLGCYEQSKMLFEPSHFELHQIYRALSVLHNEIDYIQAQLYQASKNLVPRQTGVLYYDCTNFYFEIEEEEGLKQYGVSKENRPNPIVEFGLFMDKSGFPLAFNISSGNTNEQTMLCPLEKTIMSDFELSKFVVCTDAGLSSNANRCYNNWGERSFITTQSVKKLKKELKTWALSSTGWKVAGREGEFDISTIEDTEANAELVFYKSEYIPGYDEERDIEFNQNLIVTWSLKYKKYQQEVRNRQIERAIAALNGASCQIDKKRPTDYKRFIKRTDCTSEGEIAKIKQYEIDDEAIAKEAQYDGFYAVATNLDDDVQTIIAVNKGRWEIEQCFRLMKSDFKARPVYVKRDDRIAAHFLTCYCALLIYKVLNKLLGNRFTSDEILSTLRKMNVTKAGKAGFIPSYTRSALTDALHLMADFETDREIMSSTYMKQVCKKSRLRPKAITQKV